jgi:hypothetical protein
MAKTTITFELEQDDNPTDYVNPIGVLCIIRSITGYLRQLDKYDVGVEDFKSIRDAITQIRIRVKDLCEGIDSEWLL